jgi:hypothetical protein
VVFVAGALPPHPHKELSFLDLVHCERCAFKKPKVFGVPFLKKGNKGNKKSLTTQNTQDPDFFGQVYAMSMPDRANLALNMASILR